MKFLDLLREFEIKKEASYIISVKNPDIQVPGFAAFSAKDKRPHYPKYLKEKFSETRWIDVDNPKLMDNKNTQLLLIGARKKNVEEELGTNMVQLVHALNNTASQIAAHSFAISASGLPIAAAFGFVPGALVGFKKA